MVLDACTRAFHCPEQHSAAEAIRVIAVSPARLSMRYLFSQVSHHPQPHNTPLYRLESSLLPREQSVRTR